MEEDAYAEMREQEERHWWFRGRRAIIWALLHHASLPPSPRLLDAGCGTGRNLVEFGRLGPALGVDPSAEAVEFCHQRGLGDVRCARLECLPFATGAFDLVLACDVLEHIEDDVGALRELRRVTSDGGYLIITVPAYQWMWTQHDVQLHHLRRYTGAVLRARVETSGWTVARATFFNSILFPAVAVARLITGSSSRRGHTDLDRTPATLNRLLELPMRLEAAMVRRGMTLPAGVSLGLVCRAPGVKDLVDGYEAPRDPRGDRLH
ncbi:MAG TPA: methyltransferase domain-containing protein [Acidimicrobiales bacterium]|nr:methyltransferase domain-containing protein [Acidimicrobiales bacterium]